MKPEVREEDLIKILQESTKELFNFLKSQFVDRFNSDENFSRKIKLWAQEIKLDVTDDKFIEKLCKEGAYNLINRVLFYRIGEDKTPNLQITEGSLLEWRRAWREATEKPSKKLSKLFKEVATEYKNFFNAPLFNSIGFDDIEWNDEVILKILGSFANLDFKNTNNDILGKAYERHIPSEERKRLGQFYTPSYIINYLLEDLELTKTQG